MISLAYAPAYPEDDGKMSLTGGNDWKLVKPRKERERRFAYHSMPYMFLFQPKTIVTYDEVENFRGDPCFEAILMSIFVLVWQLWFYADLGCLALDNELDREI